MVTALNPSSRGMVADQRVVPEAVPEEPVLVDQVTLTTPTLSEAVPEKGMDDASVERLVPPGEMIVSDGGVVSPLEGGVGDGDGVGVGVGVGVGDGDGVGVGVGVGDGDGGGVGGGVGIGVGAGAGFDCSAAG